MIAVRGHRLKLRSGYGMDLSPRQRCMERRIPEKAVGRPELFPDASSLERAAACQMTDRSRRKPKPPLPMLNFSLRRDGQRTDGRTDNHTLLIAARDEREEEWLLVGHPTIISGDGPRHARSTVLEKINYQLLLCAKHR